MRPATALIGVLPFLVGGPVDGQTRFVTGVVSTPDGRPVPGASVDVRCGTTAAKRITDGSGVFAIEDPERAGCHVIIVAPWFEVVTATIGPATPTPVRIVVARDRAAGESRVGLSLSEALRDVSGSPSGALRLGDHWLAQGAFAPFAGQSQAGFGQQWATKATATVRLRGGVEVAASAIARRGYDRPLFMAESIGSDVVMPGGPAYYLDTSNAPVIWDTELRVRKRLKSIGPVQIDFVGEAFNLLDVNQSLPASSSASSSTLTSRTLRFGFVFGW